MRNLCIALCLLEALLFYANAQRVAPGVPPQHYQQQQYQPPQYQQQQPPPQQQQQQQYQQAQYQQQQVPVQQQQIPNQPQHGHGHGHHAPHNPEHVLNTANIAKEKEHIAEHLDVPIDTSKMSDQELQFHYFKMHDADNNNKLDGCELVKSLLHWHDQGSKSGQNHIEEKIFQDEELVTLIDPILNMDDGNRDGFIDYPEFVRAQQKAAASTQH
ncbi:hypothetical protein RN001_016040 [Aquatica leii]|uniref:EF-hand domain-containing protein n=1 Tax=Aquatica leii TaxID=1421715 RepID=A0AAN7NYV3_9COLE|nr:hypothetical protein RN001_016040 [Aquatica leii]